jgi:hypothetical protein
LRAMCMWSMHHFPASGLFAWCFTKGHVGCPFCGSPIKARSSRNWREWFIVGVDVIYQRPVPIDELELLSMVKQKTWWLLCEWLHQIS